MLLQVRIRVRSNEVVDPKALVARCQKEIAQLREQLAAALAGALSTWATSSEACRIAQEQASEFACMAQKQHVPAAFLP